MEYPQDYLGSAADRSQLAARRPLRDTRKEVRLPYHPYDHEQWRSRLPTNQQQQPPNEQQETRFVPTTTGHVGASNAPAFAPPAVGPAVPLSSYRRILLLGPPSPSSNASDNRLVSPINRNNYYVSSQYLPSRCENDVGHEAPPQYFRREVVRRDNDREKVTVNFLAAMASRMEMLPRATKDMDDSEKSKHAGLDVSLHL